MAQIISSNVLAQGLVLLGQIVIGSAPYVIADVVLLQVFLQSLPSSQAHLVDLIQAISSSDGTVGNVLSSSSRVTL